FRLSLMRSAKVGTSSERQPSSMTVTKRRPSRSLSDWWKMVAITGPLASGLSRTEVWSKPISGVERLTKWRGPSMTHPSSRPHSTDRQLSAAVLVPELHLSAGTLELGDQEVEPHRLTRTAHARHEHVAQPGDVQVEAVGLTRGVAEQGDRLAPEPVPIASGLSMQRCKGAECTRG